MKRPLEIYIHIPFCKQKCLYCDFLSFKEGEEWQALYFDALEKEIDISAAALKDYEVTSVFIGGGTPTYVACEYILRIMNEIRRGFDITEDAEITIECNPGTATYDALRSYREAGISRISIGLQSPDDSELRLLGRIHDRKQFEECYKNAVTAGFENINVDLMCALPGQNIAGFENNLKYVLGLDPAPKHISAYSLIIEEGTPFYDMYKDENGVAHGMPALPDEDTERDMYHMTEKILGEAGYHRYEISNYAMEGFECLHNIGYWQCNEYIGFGLGASSLVNGVRFSNISEPDRYIEAVLHSSRPAGKNSAPVSDDVSNLIERDYREELSLQAMMEEFMFMGLRRTCGVLADEFKRRFGRDIFDVYGDVISELREEGLMVIDDGRIFLTSYGLDISNYCMVKFLM